MRGGVIRLESGNCVYFEFKGNTLGVSDSDIPFIKGLKELLDKYEISEFKADTKVGY